MSHEKHDPRKALVPDPPSDSLASSSGMSSPAATGGGDAELVDTKAQPSPPSTSPDYVSPLASRPHTGADALEVHHHYMLMARTLSDPGVYTAMLIGNMSHYVDYSRTGLSRTNWDAIHHVQWENSVVKRCSCGSLITVYDWLNALKFVGVQDDGVDLLELRNCTECQTTLAIRVGDSPERSKRRAAMDVESASGMPDLDAVIEAEKKAERGEL